MKASDFAEIPPTLALALGSSTIPLLLRLVHSITQRASLVFVPCRNAVKVPEEMKRVCQSYRLQGAISCLACPVIAYCGALVIMLGYCPGSRQ
jgi:hypothetical protein